MPKKEWAPLEEQMKIGFIYEGDNPVKIPYPGGYYLVKPGEEFLFPEQIGLKLRGRKGFKETSEYKGDSNEPTILPEEKPKKSKKKKDAELEDEKPEESIEEVSESE